MFGSICWNCHWGWPKPVADIYLKALAKLEGNDSPLQFGPSHIVWSDENFDSAEWCLKHFNDLDYDYGPVELAVVRESLEELSALPREVWDVEPRGYDGVHPENCPPPPGVVMVKV
jgi:hypothetical protein